MSIHKSTGILVDTTGRMSHNVHQFLVLYLVFCWDSAVRFTAKMEHEQVTIDQRIDSFPAATIDSEIRKTTTAAPRLQEGMTPDGEKKCDVDGDTGLPHACCPHCIAQSSSNDDIATQILALKTLMEENQRQIKQRGSELQFQAILK